MLLSSSWNSCGELHCTCINFLGRIFHIIKKIGLLCELFKLKGLHVFDLKKKLLIFQRVKKNDNENNILKFQEKNLNDSDKI